MPDLDLHAPVEELARLLIDIPSVSGGEHAIADAVERALTALPHLTVTRDGDAIIARTETGAPERVIIAGHLDTVPIKGNVPAQWRDDGATLWGRGSVDMKGGLAVMLSLAASLERPMRDVTWVLYDHEEVEESKNGLGRLSRRHAELLTADFAVLCEPTSAAIEGGCNGTLRADVTLPGIAAHSARAWKGANAIHRAAPLLTALAAYEPASVDVDGLTYREGLNAVGIRGGIAGNVIPDACTVTVNYRFAPDKTLAQAQAHVEAVIASAGLGEWDLEWTDLAAACRPGLDAPLAMSFADAVAAAGGGAPRAKEGWTDVARFGDLGIPAVNYGPGDPELAHADEEWCPVTDIQACRAGLKAWLSP
ncbi:succinyl-diaminopimelate desuccinylase [Demequina muriae]|uniref:Succinyl-diaminopimelate desuccinylase n=1 Tax=Demequina muriae TaxID=3051664 RepID=A0ABT8GGA9_9MICO|nr:succinyl-diaminopimelate desuccinylase [Demequina sp. EGI L300058]MDN4479986.1 succinyl-diaminopimelate desuccinylase [Demequina sp. EGI L300058]